MSAMKPATNSENRGESRAGGQYEQNTKTSGMTGTQRAESQGAHVQGGTDNRSGPGPYVMAASTLEGDSVVNSQGDSLGDIKAIMIDVPNGRVAYAVLAFGGFLGMGEKLFAIPWSAMTLDADEKHFILDIPEEQLKQAPGFDKKHWPSMADQAWGTQIHSFYGRRPYWEN
jgi:sporulation protein YlmC with PRC-barrel domain